MAHRATLIKICIQKIFVGLVEQYRSKEGGIVLNIPRGFQEPEESHEATASRELMEEMGLAGKPILLPGAAMNPNSTFFETGGNGGVKLYTLSLRPDQFCLNNKIELISGNDDNNVVEIIGKCQFLNIKEAVWLSDMFTVAAVGRLKTWLGLD